jgi:RimJ/RimL family protein N-acetyltransferase
VGWFHLRPDRERPEDLDLGYRLIRRVWGRGYATEGGRALVDHAFAVCGAPRVVAYALAGNRASQRVMEKCGLRFELSFTYREEILPGWTEAERGAVRYALSRDEWARAKGG